MKPTLFVIRTAAAIAIVTIAAATVHTQRSWQEPHIPSVAGKRAGIRPCSSLRAPGSCAPGPSIDVSRYIPPPDNSLSGGLRLQIRPASASVYVDGHYAGLVNEFDGSSERLLLSPGPHSIVVRAAGYKPRDIETRARIGQTTVYRGTLSPVTP